MMVVVLPVIISLLLATLLAPLAGWLGGTGFAEAPGRVRSRSVLAFVVFLGLWGLVIPPFVAQVPDVIDNVQQGAGQVADVAVAARHLPAGRPGRDPAGRATSCRAARWPAPCSPAPMLLAQWAAAIVLDRWC